MKKEIFNQLKQKLIDDGYADDDVIGVGKYYKENIWMAFFGTLSYEVGTDQLFFMVNGQELVVVPYNKKEGLKYDKVDRFHKDDIKKIGGWGVGFVIKTNDKKKYHFAIQMNKPAFKEIKKRMGF